MDHESSSHTHLLPASRIFLFTAAAASCWLLLKIRSASLCLCGARGSSDNSGVLLRGTFPLPAYISAFFADLVSLIWSCFCVALLCSCCDAACGTFN